MSLLDVELASQGSIKAVVLGSYERGSRALSVKRIIQLADFYGVPVHTLFGSFPNESCIEPGNIVIDLRRVRNYRQQISEVEPDAYQPLVKFLIHVQNARQDWTGEVISLRSGDLNPLVIFLGTTQTALLNWLIRERLLIKAQS
jgi:transcriptional regulator with XRE-family HTH domain